MLPTMTREFGKSFIAEPAKNVIVSAAHCENGREKIIKDAILVMET